MSPPVHPPSGVDLNGSDASVAQRWKDHGLCPLEFFVGPWTPPLTSSIWVT